MATYGYTFQSGDGVTPTRLNDARTVSDIVNADIKSDAAIAHSKLANITAGQVLLGNASNVPTATALTGDVTVTSGGVTAIGSAKVVTSMINNAAVTAAKLDGAQTGSAPIYGCRAWVNFNAGAGSTVGGEFRCTIRASGNVSKVVRTADPGAFTITFTTAMPSADYAAVASGSHASLASRGTNFETFDTTTTTFKMTTAYASPTTNGTFYNPEFVHVAVFA